MTINLQTAFRFLFARGHSLPAEVKPEIQTSKMDANWWDPFKRITIIVEDPSLLDVTEPHVAPEEKEAADECEDYAAYEQSRSGRLGF